mgnify:CR=1 FL=1
MVKATCPSLIYLTISLLSNICWTVSNKCRGKLTRKPSIIATGSGPYLPPLLVNKPRKGHFAKAGVANKKYLKEFKFENAADFTVGQEIKVDIFAEGDKIDATGISKGKGFQGAIKRHGQSRGPMAHGSKFHRHAGSSGAATSPGRVFKGKKMPGQMGNVKSTVQNLEVVKIDTENNVILVKGSVPGPKKAMVILKQSVKSN